MTDNPRDILRAAGVECREVEEYMMATGPMFPDKDRREFIVRHFALSAILALARLVAKYKAEDEKVIADLDRRWEERDADA